MRKVATTRFGDLEVDEDKIFSFETGPIGFPHEQSFIVVERGSRVVWLQSTTSPEIAFPALDSVHIGDWYPERPPNDLAREAGLAGPHVLALVIAHVRDERLCVDLLAPVLLDLDGKRGAQIVLDPQRYATSVPLGAAVRPPALTGERTAEACPSP